MAAPCLMPVPPLCVDLFCGLGGWSEGFLAEGYRVVGFDIERHDYSRVCPMCHGTGACNGIPDCLACDRTGRIGARGYPGELVIQDVLTLHGSQLRHASCIVASPPCQEFSYMAMPWSRAKQIAAALREEAPFPEGYTGSRTVGQLTALFRACFRIQQEASEAAGRYIPMVVENVKGAQPWVGEAKAHFGSYYLWGDVGMVGRRVIAGGALSFGGGVKPLGIVKGHGGTWFGVQNNGDTYDQREVNPCRGNALKTEGHANIRDGHTHTRHLTNQRESDAVKVGGFTWSDHGKPGYKPRGFNVEAAKAIKHGGDCFSDPAWPGKAGGTKQHGSGAEWFDQGIAAHSSRSDSRKAASAQIAKIPFALAQYVARAYQPCHQTTP